MKIVQRQDDENGAEMELALVQRDGRNFVYFRKPGTDKANLNDPYFVIKVSVAWGDVGPFIHDFELLVEQFVCPNFADRKELERLRADSAKWQGEAVDPEELKRLRADSAELERLREKQREISRLRARLVELEGQDDAV